MKYILIAGILFFSSCSTGPLPLVPGKDACTFCQMPVADTRFGAEIITAKGKLYKFDDIGCMSHFLKNGLSANEKIQNIFVVSYLHRQNFVEVSKSFFLKSVDVHSPMNSGIAAFESLNEATPLLKDFPGEILSWDELQQKLK